MASYGAAACDLLHKKGKIVAVVLCVCGGGGDPELDLLLAASLQVHGSSLVLLYPLWLGPKCVVPEQEDYNIGMLVEGYVAGVRKRCFLAGELRLFPRTHFLTIIAIGRWVFCGVPLKGSMLGLAGCIGWRNLFELTPPTSSSSL